MRILASNPDTLGDLILRQPLYAALRAAGHELMLLVRPGGREAAAYAAPGAAVIELPDEPYARDVAERWAAFEPAVKAALDFGADVLLVAPYRWTNFEERLAAALPPWVKTAGMSGHLFAGDPRAGDAAVSTLRFDITADVAEDEPEVQKNAKLAAALGATVASADPAIAPTEAGLTLANERIHALGLAGSPFWIACVTGTAHVSLKTWPVEKWAELLPAWAARHPERRLLFTGLAKERADAEAVISRLPSDLAARCAVWAEPGGTVDELVALTSLAGGYLGHDTGPMHVAAALGKPVIGVFGGGTWPRFVPAVSPSVAVMLHVPCVGCGWSCAFATSHCIKDVPVDAVLAAAMDLADGRITGRERRELRPSAELLSRMTREASRVVLREVRHSAQVGRDIVSAHAARQKEAEDAARAREDARAALEGRDVFAAAKREIEERAENLQKEVHRLEAETAERAAAVAAMTARLNEQTQTIMTVGTAAAQFAETSGAAGNDLAPPPPTEPDELRKLRQSVEKLKRRILELQQQVTRRPTRRPLRQVLTELAVGSRTYPVTPPRPLPRVTIVTPSLNDAARLRRTIESVAAQDFQDLEYIVVDGGSTDGTPAVLEEFKSRIDKAIVEPDDGPIRAAAKGLELARGDVVHVLFAGDVLEPGGVLRVAEYFSRHRGANAAYFEDAVEAPGGWRFVPPREAKADVTTLLGSENRFRHGVWFRRDHYGRLGKLNADLGRAAEWDLYARFDRRWGLRRGDGQVRTVRFRDVDSDSAAKYREDLGRARPAFLGTFGLAGQLRCRAIHAFNVLRHALGSGDRLRFGFDAAKGKLLPAVDPPPFVGGQPVSPLSLRHPDRLLFSAPDTNGGDRGLNVVYYDSASGAALTYPPMSLEKLNALYQANARGGQRPVVPPADGAASPFAGYTGSGLAKLLSRLPTPYWFFTKPRFDDTTADDLLAAIGDLKSAHDADVRLLVVSCFEGDVLDALKSHPKWRVAGTDTNDVALDVARRKGHAVWSTSPMEAASSIPTSEQFDVLFLNSVTEHLQDPLLVLRRLRQLLRPGGLIVLNQPNLDSKLLTLYGPTWFHWQPPYHRTLMGRRAVKRLAALADLKLESFRTVTQPYSATASAQLNALGLGAIVPEGASFSNEMSSRGVRLTGWARLLWDWRGKGDVMFAVLRAV